MRLGTLVLTGLSALLLLAGAFASLGTFIIDESVYLLGADIFRTTGGFSLDNGEARFSSPNLTWLYFLPPGPEGQTTQYPPGTSILGAGLMILFDARGLIYLNVAATIGCLFVTRSIARDLFGDDPRGLWASLLLVAGTFVVEYALGYWPHMVSVLAVNLSFLMFWRALTRETGRIGHAFASGLIIGLGMHFRLDTILVLPAIGLIALIFAARWRHMVEIAIGGCAGLLLPIAALAAINHTRYGTWNPLSYGGTPTGGTSLMNYLPQISVILLLAGALVAIRAIGPRVRPGLWGLILLIAAGIGLATLPQLQKLALSYIRGVLALIVDAQLIIDTRPGVKVDESDGLLEFWGLAKKALGQSLPWLGILFALIGLGWRDDRRSISALLILVAVWSFPFLVRIWHGGLGSNMRYFLPILPALSILAIWTFARMMQGDDHAKRLLFAGGLIGALMGPVWTSAAPTGLDGAHQVLSTWVFLAVAATGLLAGGLPSATLRRLALVLGAIGLGVGAFNGLTDTSIAQVRRESVAAMTDLSQGVEGPALVYRHPYRSVMLAPDQYAAFTGGYAPDASLIGEALDAGLRVLMPDYMALEFTAAEPEYEVKGVAQPPFWMLDVARASSE